MFGAQRLNRWWDEKSISKEKRLYVFLNENGEEEEELSLSDLNRAALAISADLSSKGLKPGDVAVLMFEPSLDFIRVFLGCVYSGVIAVPISPPNPSSMHSSLDAIDKIIEDCQPKIALTTKKLKTYLQFQNIWSGDGSSTGRGFSWFTTLSVSSIVSSFQGKESNTFNPTDDTPIMLQYSSGSTGVPKGIILSHKNIFSNCTDIQKFCGTNSSSIAVSWLPMYHDMGLMSHMFVPLLVGPGLQIIMSPITFLKRPVIWLETISKYKATISGGPNFAYSILANKFADPETHKVSLDLSSWKVAFSGAEPVRSATMNQFSKEFSKWGFSRESFYPVYGMGEATLLISNSQTRRNPTVLRVVKDKLSLGSVEVSTKQEDSLEIVGLGSVHETTKIRVVNPETRTICQEGKVGEFWIWNQSVSKGYWKKPELSAEVFNAFTCDTQEGPFLRTGDLGFIQNGELFFTSRLKDLIIIDGVNYWPQDVEQAVEICHPSLRKGCCAAFSFENDKTNSEDLAIMIEVRAGLTLNDAEEEKIKANIQQAVSLSNRIGIKEENIVLLRAGTIPKTTSGKIRRFQCKNLFLEKGIETARSTLKPISKKIQERVAITLLFLLSYIGTLVKIFKVGKQITLSKLNRALFNWDNVDPKIKETEDFLTKSLQAHLNLKEISKEVPFSQYGMKSVDAVVLSGELERFTGKKISPASFYQYYNISKLADFIVNGDSKNSQSKEITGMTTTKLSAAAPPSEEKRAFILGAGKALPDFQLNQESIPKILMENSEKLSNDESLQNKLHKIFDATSIGSRYLVMKPNELAKLDTIEERNLAYNKYAPKLAAKAALEAIKSWGGDVKDITHVLSVSCTGTSVPGLEYLLIDELKLNRNVIRLGINFMGCFGGLAGLRTAQSIALADPSHRVLLVCTELCSLQVQKDDMRSDNLVADALFGDGSSAMIVGNKHSNERASFEIMKASCFALPETSDKIRWDLSNTGWRVGLEPDIGFHLGRYIKSFCESLAQEDDFTNYEFAIHPGGKAIIEVIENLLALKKSQTVSTWSVYENFGNMSSATILFVLENMMKQNLTQGRKIVSLAFGPGLSIEGILLEKSQ